MKGAVAGGRDAHDTGRLWRAAAMPPLWVGRCSKLTVLELIEEESAWERRGGWPDPDELVEVRVEYREHELRRQIKRARGWWIPARRVWRLPRYRAVELALDGRVAGR